MIICSYSHYAQLKEKNYNKKIHYDRFCPDKDWYYFSKTGQLRAVRDSKIWAFVYDENGGPTGLLKRIR